MNTNALTIIDASHKKRINTVLLVVDDQYTFKAAAKAVGVSEKSLRDWHKRFALPPKPCGEDMLLSTTTSASCASRSRPATCFTWSSPPVLSRSGNCSNSCSWITKSECSAFISWFCQTGSLRLPSGAAGGGA